jgi:hypothetical protein
VKIDANLSIQNQSSNSGSSDRRSVYLSARLYRFLPSTVSFFFDDSALLQSPQGEIKEMIMPAKSKAQQMAAGAALSAKRGEKSKSELKGASKSMAGSMSEKELRAMASTSRKSKPSHSTKKS